MIDNLIYYGGYWTSFWSFTLGWSFRAGGRAHVPVTGPVMLVSNHCSHFDPWLIGLAAPRQLTYLARSTLFKNRFFAKFIRAYGAMPIDRDFGREGLESVFQMLDRGKAVIMFPEGTRSEDGKMQELKPGVSLLVKRTEATIIPCAIAGTFAAWPRSGKFPKASPLFLPDSGRSIAVHFGEPVPPGLYKGMKRDAILGDLQSRIGEAYGHAEELRRKG
jgi:1-acyl-sn-glycerol-3-phosphate acyltransferase